jgi:hypothetical protein
LGSPPGNAGVGILFSIGGEDPRRAARISDRSKRHPPMGRDWDGTGRDGTGRDWDGTGLGRDGALTRLD